MQVRDEEPTPARDDGYMDVAEVFDGQDLAYMQVSEALHPTPLKLERASLTRLEAEKILLRSRPGDFLTRTRSDGDIVVSTRVAK